MSPHPLSGPDPSKPASSATGVFRSQPNDATFEADFADLAARFAAQSGGGLSPELSADLALEIVLNEVVEQACLATGATGAAIVLERGGEMVCRACTGATAPELGARFDADSGLSGECIRTRRTQRCDDVLADQRVDIEASARLGVRSVMVMPLLQGAELVGVFELFSSLPGAFGERDERTLEALAGRILNNLMLSGREVAVEPALLQPEAAVVSEPAPIAEPESPSGPFVSEAAVSEPSISESWSEPGSEPGQEANVGIVEGSSRRGFDLLTSFLGAAVLVCAVLLGVLLGRHVGFQKATGRAHPAIPSAVPAAAPAVNANSIAPMQAVSSPTVAKDGNVSAPALSASASGDVVPPGSLRVYENGREVFRQSAAETPAQAEGDEAASKPVGSASRGQGSGMQRAASIEPAPEKIAIPPTVAESSVLRRVEPEYPEDARQMRLQGPVVLDVHIRQDGSVQGITLVSGQPLLVQAAKDAVEQWRFKPRSVNGHPAAMETRITLNFRLPQ
jgi:TonB family protein